MLKNKQDILEKRRQALLRRLRAIEGQIKGLQKMVEEKREYLDILTQIASTQEALRSAGKVLMQNYLETCTVRAIRAEDREAQNKIYCQLMEMIYKFAR